VGNDGRTHSNCSPSLGGLFGNFGAAIVAYDKPESDKPESNKPESNKPESNKPESNAVDRNPTIYLSIS